MPQCISPILVRSNSRRDYVPCGKCNFCLQTKRAEWTFRLMQEWKKANTAKFLTLTYDELTQPWRSYSGEMHTLPEWIKLPMSEKDDNGNPCDPQVKPSVNKRDITLFTKRLRKENAAVVDWPIRYYTVAEYGTNTARPHYHSIMFNMAPEVSNKILDIWQLGYVDVAKVSQASIHYVTKYVINRTTDYPGREPPFSFMSRRPGLGVEYLDKSAYWHLNGMRNYTQQLGTHAILPRYYKNKIFTDAERKSMANKAQVEADKTYTQQIEHLSKFHEDPYAYYDERTQNTHENVTNKINSLNKF